MINKKWVNSVQFPLGKGDGEGNIDPTAANLQLSQVNPHTHTNRQPSHAHQPKGIWHLFMDFMHVLDQIRRQNVWQ